MPFGLPKKPRVKCFDAAYEERDFWERLYVGYRLVPLAKIVGTVGRCLVLDSEFRPVGKTSRGQRFRYGQMKKLLDNYVILPPVELYRLHDAYYVVDGNHRVRAAKEMGAVDIDAYVTEFVPTGDNVQDRLSRERLAFERHTRLSNVSLSQLSQYPRLHDQIRRHHSQMAVVARRTGESSPPVEVDEAARDWHRTVFRPVLRLIEDRGLHQRVTGVTSADLYLWATDRKRFLAKNDARDASWDEVLDYFEALFPAHTLMERLKDRLWPVTRLLQRALPALSTPEPCDFAFEATTGAWYCRTHLQSDTDGAESSSLPPAD